MKLIAMAMARSTRGVPTHHEEDKSVLRTLIRLGHVASSRQASCILGDVLNLRSVQVHVHQMRCRARFDLPLCHSTCSLAGSVDYDNAMQEVLLIQCSTKK